MTAREVILIVAGAMLAVGILTVLAWFIYTTYLDRVERRLAARKGLYRELVSDLATRDRALLEPTIHQMSTLYDLDALEAVLEEQARTATGRPGWLVEVYDRLGLVDKYIDKLRSARKWRDRAFAAELLGRVGSAKAVPVLLETVNATRTEDSDVREIALRALARIGDPGAVDPLIRALASADVWLAPRIADILTRHGEAVIDPLLSVLGDSAQPPARAWAANVLGEVRAQRAFPALIRALGDPEDEVRAKAATALGRIGDRRATGYLLEHLLTDPAPFVRLRIASALGRFRGPEVIDRLVRALGDSAWWVRLRSVEALEQIGSEAAAPLLVALDDDDPEIRVRAAVALERLGVPDNLVRMIEDGDRVPEASDTLVKFARAGARELLAELVLHPSSRVRETVVTALHRAERADLSSELIQIAAADPEPSVRAKAFEALRALRVSAALPAALAAIADPDQRVRSQAISFMGELGGSDAIALLRAQSLDPEAEVRTAAIRALGALGATEAESDFLRLLGDAEPAVREAAISAAVAAELRSVTPALIDLLGDKESSVRRKAAHAIGLLGDRAVAPRLQRALPEATADVREVLLVTLTRLDPEAMAGLVGTLAESLDQDSKLSVLRALRRPRSVQALLVLEQFSQDPDPAVRAAAVQALGRGGRPVPGGLLDPDDTVRASAVDSYAVAEAPEGENDFVALLDSDPSALVRERAALAVGLLRPPKGEEALVAACQRAEPANVHAAAVLGSGAFDRESLSNRVLEMPDQTAVRELLRDRLSHDARFRLLRARLSPARRLELGALTASGAREAQTSLTAAMRGILDADERVHLISSLRAFQGEQSRDVLLEIVRGDPTPEVRTAALSAVSDFLDPGELLRTGSRALGDPHVSVREAAVTLFTRMSSDRALAKLIQVLRVDEEPAVLTKVAAFAQEHFASFAEIARGVPLDSDRAVLIIRIIRYIHHPDLPGLLPPIARSAYPEVRAAVAELWRYRPDTADSESLEALSTDPVVFVRQSAAAAALAAGRYEILEYMTQDPDATVRREVAIVLGRGAPVGRPGLATLERLAGDYDMAVRAAAHVARLLQGRSLPLPPGLDAQMAAQAVLDIADLASLRQTARTAGGEEQRLAAALALALLQDDVAREVARTDPVPAIRHRVSGALELSIATAAGASR
ncbi:MAG TPA: HEAT repeat domain-containing protein [Gemmatimonadales bacterium]|nr:HEAT repeat domain-containing protein [Gemmatimonadales bacterium]